MMGYLHALLLVVSLLSVCKESFSGPVQRRLNDDLLKSLSPLDRPVANDSETLIVELGINLLQILDVDEKNQVLTTNAWLQMSWVAYNLAWDEKDYPGVRNVRFPNSMIWKPDIRLYNSADERDDTSNTNIVVAPDGNCFYIPTAILKSTCEMDVRWFPFDEQRCKLKFGSWTHSGFDLNLKMTETDLSQYIPNAEWDLVEMPGVKSDVRYQCCPDEAYPDITYTVVMRRRTLYYGLHLLLPCFIVSVLALMVFVLPAESGEKISLGITVLLSLTVLMLLVSEVMPPTSATVPLISQYFATTMVIVGLSLIATVLVLHFHHHDPNGSRMPQWVRVFLFDWCAWFLRMKRPGQERERPSWPDNGTVDLNLKSSSSGPQSEMRSGEEDPLVPGLCVGAESELGKILLEVRYMAARFRERERGEAVCNEWKFAGAVVDRLCLVVFAVFVALCTLIILMSAPSFG